MELQDLLGEYDRALAHTESLWVDLTLDEVHWRPHEQSSAIGWHLGHQPAVAHFMVRNLTAAEPPIDAALDRLMDSATSEPDRGDLPDLARIRSYRDDVAARVHHWVATIDRGEVGAPVQLRFIAETMMTSIINHEYQHSQWIREVRRDDLGHAVPDLPGGGALTLLDGYPVIGVTA